MASFDLSWTAAGGGNSTGQQVQYKDGCFYVDSGGYVGGVGE